LLHNKNKKVNPGVISLLGFYILQGFCGNQTTSVAKALFCVPSPLMVSMQNKNKATKSLQSIVKSKADEMYRLCFLLLTEAILWLIRLICSP